MDTHIQPKPSVRIQNSLLSGVEKKALLWLAARQPRWVHSDMLTLTGHIGALVIALGYILSFYDVNFLWLSCIGLIINWYGDSLDGTLARFRHQQRPVYGFYVDHTVDALNEAVMFIGVGLSPFMRFDLACILLSLYLMLTLNVAVNTYLRGEFRLTYARMGPTEFRLIAFLANLALIFVKPIRTFSLTLGWFGSALELRILDLVGLAILLILAAIYFVTILQDARYYARVDPRKRNG